MKNQGAEFSIFRGTHVRFDIRINISIFLISMITRFCKQVHLQDLIQMRLIKQILVMSLRQDHATN